MIDYKQTLANIHEVLPEASVDTLIKILDGIVECSTVKDGYSRIINNEPFKKIINPTQPYINTSPYPLETWYNTTDSNSDSRNANFKPASSPYPYETRACTTTPLEKNVDANYTC